MVVKLFIDVAGSELEHRTVTAAGYIASEAQLAAFRPAWEAVLARAGAKDKIFHANEFFHRSGRFSQLKPASEAARHQALAREFATVAHVNLPNALAYSLDCYHFSDFLGPVFAKAKTPHDRMPAAVLAVAGLCNRAAQDCLPPSCGKHGIVFVEEGGDTGEILTYLRWLKEIGEPWTAAFLEFLPILKTDFAVQAADLLAYEVWHETTRVLEDPERNGKWAAIERDTFKILATGPAMLPPVPGGHVRIDYATEQHYRHSAPAFAAFIAANIQYQRPTWRHRWQRNLRLWWNRKRRHAMKYFKGRAKRIYYETRNHFRL